jgi:hypothetical protein
MTTLQQKFAAPAQLLIKLQKSVLRRWKTFFNLKGQGLLKIKKKMSIGTIASRDKWFNTTLTPF